MSNPNAPQHPARDQYEVIALNRGLSRSGDSPEQVQLDMIYNFKFPEAYVQAKVSTSYMEESNELNLASTDLCNRLCTLAWMVISYSHLVTFWQTALTRKPTSESAMMVERWLTHRVVIGYELIDQGKRFSPKDPKDDDLSADSWMKMMHNMGITKAQPAVVSMILSRVVIGGERNSSFPSVTVQKHNYYSNISNFRRLYLIPSLST